MLSGMWYNDRMSKVEKVIIGFTFLLFLGGCASGRRSGESGMSWELEEFFIFAGWPLEVDCPDDEALIKAIAELDHNAIMWDTSKLELCRKYNLKLVIDHGQGDWRPGGNSRWAVIWQDYLDSVEPLTAEITGRYVGNDDVWGYIVYDEPVVEQFEDVRAQQAVLNEADPTHPAYINLHSWGGDYLAKFMETVKPNFLSYDFYQWWWGRERHFPCLEEYRAAALKADIPLFCWIEVNANKDTERNSDAEPPADNGVKLRQSVYTSLAYGVKGIEWFCTSYVFEYGTANVTSAGRDMGAINKKLKRIGPILVKLRSTEVFHTEPVSAGTKKLPADHWVQTETKDLVVGFFKDEDDAKSDYLLVANKDIEEQRIVRLEFGRGVKKVRKYNKLKGKWASLRMKKLGEKKSVKFILEPGDGDILRIVY